MAYTVTSNHNNIVLNIHKMVFNRIPFLLDSQNNADIISNYIVEAANELEGCFKVSLFDDDGEPLASSDDSRIADESKYNNSQKSLIADYVAVYLLRRLAAIGSSGKVIDEETGDVSVTASQSNNNTFLSGAKAGSVEVSYSQYSSGTKVTNGFQLEVANLIEQYEKSAYSKGVNMGCNLDICRDCADKATPAQAQAVTSSPVPFIVVNPSE